MTQLLVSVRSVVEAEAAMQGGADIIDVKEPVRGSLGRAEEGIAPAIVSSVDGKVPVSVALGELLEWTGGVCDGDLPATLPCKGGERTGGQFSPWGTGTFCNSPPLQGGVGGVAASLGEPFTSVHPMISWVKFGLAGCCTRPSWPNDLARISLHFPAGSFVAAAYADAERADAPSVGHVLEVLHHWQGSVLLIDTWRKDGKGLFTWLSMPVLQRLREETRRRGVTLALAGSLKMQDVPRVMEIAPDILAVRGAACREGQRNGEVDAERVAALKRLLPISAPRRSPS